MIDLYDLVSFEGFDFAEYYEHERKILQPQLEEKGYTDIKWWKGESDSFGPLSRQVTMRTPDGKPEIGWYG